MSGEAWIILGLAGGFGTGGLVLLYSWVMRRRRRRLLRWAQSMRVPACGARAAELYDAAYRFRREFGARAFREQFIARAGTGIQPDLHWLDTAVRHGLQRELALAVLGACEETHAAYRLYYVGGLSAALLPAHSYVDLVYSAGTGLRIWSRARRTFVATLRRDGLALADDAPGLGYVPYRLHGHDAGSGAAIELGFRVEKTIVREGGRTRFDDTRAREALVSLRAWIAALPEASPVDAPGRAEMPEPESGAPDPMPV